MSVNIEQAGEDREKRTNTRLAVAIGVIGLGSLGGFYILFFLLMFLRPGLLFTFVPSPEIAASALSDGSRTYLLFQKMDFSTISPGNKSDPETKHYIALLDKGERRAEREVPAYARALGAGGRVFFLFKGGYRTYDGDRLTEVRSDAVGADPRAAFSPAGLYVLGSFEDGDRLFLVRDGAATPVPLPVEYLDGNEEDGCPCSQLVWYRGQLCLFWSRGDSIAWTAWNGAAWEPVVLSPISGSFQVLADDSRLSFFIRDEDSGEDVLRYYVLADNAWSGPTTLQLPSGCLNWGVFLQQGKLLLFTQQLTMQTVETIDRGNLVDPVRYAGAFHPGRMAGRIALLSLGTNIVTVLAVFGISVLVGRYKKRSLAAGERQYEFASIFRRFLAHLIDTAVLLLPPCIALALFFSWDDMTRNPFLPFMLIMATAVFFSLGGFLYHSFLEGLLGQTLGKKICGITVLKADFTPCTLSAGFLRNLLRIIDGFFYYLVAAVVLAATVRWQRFGDMAADTVVVRTRRAGDAAGPASPE